MWIILEARSLEKTLERLPREVLKRYEKWKDIVRMSGIHGLREIKGFHDESLRGPWNGYRSSRLGYQHRLIYRADTECVTVYVVDINAHDYRRR